MADYKKQHYLPVSYLSNFSDDPARRDRKSFVWRFDGERQIRVPVETQGYEIFFYSKEKAEAAEKSFHNMEASYCRVARELAKSGKISDKNLGGLLGYIFDLNLRNAHYQNLTNSEGLIAYQRRMNLFMTEMLVKIDPNSHEAAKGKILAHILENWRIEIVQAPENYAFITSDNPSAFMTCTTKTPKLHTALQMVMLPINPQWIALGFDRRFAQIDRRPKAKLEDMTTINLNQVQNARRCIFSSSKLVEHEVEFYRTSFLERKKSDGYVDDSRWGVSVNYIIPQFRYSFMRLTPPLL